MNRLLGALALRGDEAAFAAFVWLADSSGAQQAPGCHCVRHGSGLYWRSERLTHSVGGDV
jgi:hypothetical protein